MSGAGGARQGILSLVVKDKAALYNAYMPYIRQGGIFVPTTRRYFIGDEVFLLLTLPDSSERLPVAGKVCWVTPTGAQGNRTAGIGVPGALPVGRIGAGRGGGAGRGVGTGATGRAGATGCGGATTGCTDPWADAGLLGATGAAGLAGAGVSWAGVRCLPVRSWARRSS